MVRGTRRQILVNAALFAVALAAGGVVFAQQDPVATMFRDDLKREQALALSFLPIELLAAGAAAPLHVYLSAGDLEHAFDNPLFRPDAAIVPTNTTLDLAATSPSTQRVLVDRVSKQPAALAALREQIAARRKQGGALEIGADAFVAKLGTDSKGSLPRMVCMIPTDFPAGGAVDRRELFAQDRVRKGVAACLTALDAAGAGSVVMPLLGAASAKRQANDPEFEGQRALKECRHLNAVAGIALGIHDFAKARHTIHEIGIVQWAQEVTDMFTGGRLGPAAYRIFADQVKAAVNKGIAGENTTAGDVDGNCSATFTK